MASLLEHTTNEGNMFSKISSKYQTGLISDDWIQSQSVHIIHYTTCGQICRLTLPDRGKNLYSLQKCIPALSPTESFLTLSWFYKVVLIPWGPWEFVYLVPALPWRYRMTGWLDWKLLSYHSVSFAWASLHNTEGTVCLRERERWKEKWQDIQKRYTAVTTLLPTHEMVKKRTASRHGRVPKFEVVSCSWGIYLFKNTVKTAILWKITAISSNRFLY